MAQVGVPRARPMCPLGHTGRWEAQNQEGDSDQQEASPAPGGQEGNWGTLSECWGDGDREGSEVGPGTAQCSAPTTRGHPWKSECISLGSGERLTPKCRRDSGVCGLGGRPWG